MSRRQDRGEGKDMGGTTIRDRFEREEAERRGKEVRERVMSAGDDPNFRNRPEIAAMRKNAADFKANYRPKKAFKSSADRALGL